ncbi:biotin-(acetyl-CoA carboxylase) ligase [Litoreibacter ponti]|uniref:Biotin-(Acetyl-CoA carboxylase) ligase n=1 Tax=Litoreibacter ponti TaxID=1510457 RepID=A0A2T6BEW1_9RHOB|nr:biotin/lipoate--protein ligase family protein [Litoreibacter ponti]PTX54596.1 biotin-(acetyl-CoA carboxylase) ligase [Litoreibacter ponti]
MTEPTFPPLMSGQAVTVDPFEKACAQAALGCDAGLVVHHLASDTLRAALVFAPEVPLADAMAMLPVCGVGFQNALGALAPPEVAVHLQWDGGIRVNGASCGRLRVAASGDDPDVEPDWLVVGLELTLWPDSDETGHTPDKTALYAEGCADVDAVALLESWTRHTLVWINRWADEGVEPLHKEWRGLAHGIGEDTARDGLTGTFLGVDERFGMLLRDDATTHLIPLTTLLES